MIIVVAVQKKVQAMSHFQKRALSTINLDLPSTSKSSGALRKEITAKLLSFYKFEESESDSESVSVKRKKRKISGSSKGEILKEIEIFFTTEINF